MPVILSGRSGSALAGAVGTSAIVNGAVTAVKLDAVSNGVYNVKAYGATGDGTTDDTAAIQSAIDAMEAAGGGVVKFPGPATYEVTGLTVNSTDGVTLEGEPGALLLDVTGTASVIHCTSCNDLSIRGLSIEGPAVARDTANQGIRLDTCTRFSVDDCSVNGVEAAGIIMRGCTDGSVTNCRVRNTLADGIHMTLASKRISVAGNHLHTTGDDSIAVVSYEANGDYCTDIAITGNTVYRSKSRGIGVIGGKRVSITGNVVQSTKNAGILVYYSAAFSTYGTQDVVIAGNVVNEANTYDSPSLDQAGIDIRSGDASYPVENIRVAHNIVRGGGGWRSIHIGETAAGTFDVTLESNSVVGVSDAANYGISAVWCDGFAVVNNHVADVGAHGILVDTTVVGHVRCVGNVIENANATSGAGFDGINFKAQASSGLIANNLIVDASTRLERAIEAGTATNTVIAGNVNADDRPMQSPTAAEPMQVGAVRVFGSIEFGADAPGTVGPTVQEGTGSPEGAVTAIRGSQWLRTDGGAGTCLYVKESGSGNTGWVAK